ncbi:MAG: hypothetical protein AABX61_01510 [Nanoarchaeota archaeon]
MKDFKEFLALKVVNKQMPNKERAISLIEDSEKKKEYMETTIKLIPKQKWNSNVIVDQCYDILIELIRAKLFLDGYNSKSSHEAEVSYMKIIGFSEAETKQMDELRYYRNGTKYYGTVLNIGYAEMTIEFMNKIYQKLLRILK